MESVSPLRRLWPLLPPSVSTSELVPVTIPLKLQVLPMSSATCSPVAHPPTHVLILTMKFSHSVLVFMESLAVNNLALV